MSVMKQICDDDFKQRTCAKRSKQSVWRQMQFTHFAFDLTKKWNDCKSFLFVHLTASSQRQYHFTTKRHTVRVAEIEKENRNEKRFASRYWSRWTCSRSQLTGVCCCRSRVHQQENYILRLRAHTTDIIWLLINVDQSRHECANISFVTSKRHQCAIEQFVWA